jgi:CubicO group peptidase (beta-lactamase class C family)
MLRFGEANLGHKQIDGKVIPDDLIAAMKAAQQPIYPLPGGATKQGMAWVSNLGDAQAGNRPEILKNGGTVGFGTVILINPFKDAAIFIAVNKSGSNPAPIGVAIGRHLL